MVHHAISNRQKITQPTRTKGKTTTLIQVKPLGG